MSEAKTKKKKSVFHKDIAVEFISGGEASVAEQIKAKVYTRAHIEDAARFLLGPPVNSPEKSKALLALLPEKRPTGKIYLDSEGEILRRASKCSEARTLIRVTVDIGDAPDGSFWSQTKTTEGILLKPYAGAVIEGSNEQPDEE